jgi:pSer/pThr/pTyr-binding forkhead associated (FHA) protein
MSGTTDQLIVRLDDAIVQCYALDTQVITIGRSADNALPLPHPTVSRHHAEIRLEANVPVIVDLGSANGIYINGVRVQARQSQPLLPDAVVQIGPFTLTYDVQLGAEEDDDDPQEESTIRDVFAGWDRTAAAREDQPPIAVADLHIEVDHNKRQKQVEEITGSDYFQTLREAVSRLRSSRAQRPENEDESP